MRGTVVGDDGLQRRVSRIWVTDDAGVRHEVVRAWVGDAQGNPKIWFDKNVQLSLAVTATPLDATQVRLNWTLGPQGEVADEYHVYRGSTLLGITTLTTWTDTGLTPGTTYNYRVDVVQKGSMTVSGSATATTDTYIPPAVATLTATAASYVQVNLSWTVSGHDSFVVKRGTTTLATTGTSFSDTGLTPGTAYTYTITATKAGTPNTVVTKTATTTALPAFSMTASWDTAWNNIATSWTSLGTGWTYTLVGNGSNLLTGTTSTSYNHAVGENSDVAYTTYAYWNGTHYKTATASGSSSTRPISTGYVTGHGAASANVGYTGSTQKTLSGFGAAFPVSGTMTNVNSVVYAYSPQSSQCRVAPVIGGVERQHSIVGTTRQANDFAVSVGFGPGTHQIDMRCGGSSPAPIGSWAWAAWSPPNGGAWQTQVCVHRVDYQYYASLKAVEEMRVHPWWREELAEAVEKRSLHIETSNDGEGNFTSAKIIDKETGDVLVDWERGD